MKLFFALCQQRSSSIIRTITIQDCQNYAKLTGDTNPIHLQGESSIVHGTFLLGLVSSVMGTKCPGEGTKVLELKSKFLKPCPVGVTVEVNVNLLETRKISKADFLIKDSSNDSIKYVEGQAKLWLNT